MSQARALSSDEIRALQSELDGGGTPTVWFTSSAVGVQEGRSGKVIALDDPGEGDFIQVRPAGSKDVLSFSAGEVTLVKPPRKRKEPDTPKAKPAPDTPTAKAPDPQAPPKRATPTAKQSPAEKQSPTEKPRTTGGARRKPSPAIVTLTGDGSGQWNVEVTAGKKRVVRPTAVPASAVGQAAKALHEDVANAVEPLLDAARDEQRARVDQLQQELTEAQRLLDELE